MILEKTKIAISSTVASILAITTFILLRYDLSSEILYAYTWFTLASVPFIASFFFINFLIKKLKLFSTLSLFFLSVAIIEIIFLLAPNSRAGTQQSYAIPDQLIFSYFAVSLYLITSPGTIFKTNRSFSYPYLALSLLFVGGSFFIGQGSFKFPMFDFFPVLPLSLFLIVFYRIYNCKYWSEYLLQFWFLMFIVILAFAQLLIAISNLQNYNQLLHAADLFKGMAYMVVLCGIFVQIYKTLGKSELQAKNLFLASEEVQQEIEERRWTEEQLKESRLFSESIVESINEPLLVLDADLKIIRANPSFYTAFTLKPGQVLNRRLNKIGKSEWNNPELLHKLKSVIQKNLHLENHEISLKFQNKTMTVLLNARRIAQKDVHTNLLILTMTDITALKTAEESARLLVRGVEAASETIILTDQNGYINYVNPAYLKLTDFSFGELKGKRLNAVISGMDEIDFNELVLSNQIENNLWTGETVSYKKDGTSYDVNMTIAPVYDKFQKLEGFVSIQNDITELKKAKGELAQRATELARSNAELEQFAYVASHDLQEPLRMVSSFCALLKKRYYDKLDDDANDFIDFAVDGAKRMQTLISDLLLYSRVGTRGKPFITTDCNEVMARALTNLKVAIEDSGARISVKKLPKTVADETQLIQLFQNIIGNAIKFKNSKSPEISIAAKRKNGHWLFSIKDNGIGIEPMYKNKIFTIFQRLENKENYPGTGIGLAICKKIIERHHGKIWVKSEPHKGSTFYFTLPTMEGNSHEQGSNGTTD